MASRSQLRKNELQELHASIQALTRQQLHVSSAKLTPPTSQHLPASCVSRDSSSPGSASMPGSASTLLSYLDASRIFGHRASKSADRQTSSDRADLSHHKQTGTCHGGPEHARAGLGSVDASSCGMSCCCCIRNDSIASGGGTGCGSVSSGKTSNSTGRTLHDPDPAAPDTALQLIDPPQMHPHQHHHRQQQQHLNVSKFHQPQHQHQHQDFKLQPHQQQHGLAQDHDCQLKQTPTIFRKASTILLLPIQLLLSWCALRQLSFVEARVQQLVQKSNSAADSASHWQTMHAQCIARVSHQVSVKLDVDQQGW